MFAQSSVQCPLLDLWSSSTNRGRMGYGIANCLWQNWWHCSLFPWQLRWIIYGKTWRQQSSERTSQPGQPMGYDHHDYPLRFEHTHTQTHQRTIIAFNTPREQNQNVGADSWLNSNWESANQRVCCGQKGTRIIINHNHVERASKRKEEASPKKVFNHDHDDGNRARIVKRLSFNKWKTVFF